MASLPLVTFALTVVGVCLATPLTISEESADMGRERDTKGGVGIEPPPSGAVHLDAGTAQSAEEPTRQLSQTTQSFLATLGTALGPIVGAIVGPLLTNVGQNLAAGSGAQAISQLQQAAQAAIQQQQLQAGITVSSEAAASVAAESSTTSSSAAAVGASGAPPSVSVTPPPLNRPTRPLTRPGLGPTRPATAATMGPPSASGIPTTPRPSLDSFVVDVPGRGPVLLMLPATASATEQAAAIEQAKAQAAQLLLHSPNGGVSSLVSLLAAPMSSTPRPQPQVTKPTSVGPLPVRPAVPVTSSPLPSYHALSLVDQGDEDLDQQDEEEVARPEHAGEILENLSPHESDDDHDFSPQSFLARLFPEMI